MGKNGTVRKRMKLPEPRLYRRRSSVPDIPSPIPVGAERGSHWDSKAKQPRKARSSSATRPLNHNRQRSNTTNTPDKYSPRPTSSPTSRRHPQHPDPHHNHARPPSQQHPHHRPRPASRRPKSPSTVNESSASEASSEDSRDGRRQSRQRKSDEDGSSKKNLWVPSFLRPSHKRRHSSEAGVRRIEAAKASHASAPRILWTQTTTRCLSCCPTNAGTARYATKTAASRRPVQKRYV